MAVYPNAFNDIFDANRPDLKAVLESGMRLQPGNHA
jgi:hypothetical protein